VDHGEAAARAVLAGAYDIVFMDCHMPTLDGFEATRRIRAGESAAGAPLVIVALTADSLPSDRQRCLDAGMNDFLTKPVSSSQLSATIERWTGRRTQPATQW
jgi:CheY-like chemotaxis protein